MVEVSRHGARSPNKIYPFALHEEDNFKNTSQLTRFGRKQHHDLGRFVRRRYIEEKRLLSRHYDERETYVQTTYADRTYLSSLY